MKTKIKTAIDNIECMKEYYQSEDYLNNFYDFIQDESVYSEENINKFFSDWLTENTDITFNDKFISHLIDYVFNSVDSYIEMKESNSYWVQRNELLSFLDEEQEIQIFNEYMPDNYLTEGQKRYIEYKTDCVINDNSNYAYAMLHNSVIAVLKHDELLSDLDDIINDYNQDECELLVDDHHGQYSWQILAQICDIELSEDYKKLLLNNVYDEFYWDDVNRIETNHSFKYKDKTWFLAQLDGGIFAVSENYIYSEV